jgi:hypothetical protein
MTMTAAERLSLRVADIHTKLDAVEANFARRAEAEARADAARQANRRREIATAYSEGNSEVQAYFDSAYRDFGTSGAPVPNEGEHPQLYFSRLTRGLQDRLAPSHPLSAANITINPSLPTPALSQFGAQINNAAKLEAERPSRENLPRDGSLIERVKVDASNGTRTSTFFGIRSYIKDMAREGRRVIAFHDKEGKILYPPRARGF